MLGFGAPYIEDLTIYVNGTQVHNVKCGLIGSAEFL